MIDNRAVGKMIATLRQARGMTQQQLAAALSVSHQAVSKWENGNAMPDIQTLMELTKLFGITVEQLMNGEIPEARLEKVPESENPIQSIGKVVQGVVEGIGSFFNPAPADEEDAEAPVTDVFEESEEVQAVTEEESGEKDFVEESASEEGDAESKVSIRELLNMAPFMSKAALEEMIRASGEKPSIEEIAKFAPFISSAYLEELIRTSDSLMSWDMLKYVAPFLKKEAVDAFARMAAKGEKIVQPAAKTVNRTAEEMVKSIEHVSKKIGKGMEQAAREVVQMGKNVVNEVGKVFENSSVDLTPREVRLAKLRRQAFERAIEDERWDWIAAHLDEISEDEFKREIANRAKEKGMQEWVCKNLGGYADADMIESAIEEGKWDWLGEHVWKFSPEAQERIALAAVSEANWEWLSAHAELIDMRGCVTEIANSARLAGEKALAAQLTHFDMLSAQAERIAFDALEDGDFDFYAMIADALSQEALLNDCRTLLRSDDWAQLERFAAYLEMETVEKLMESAIEAGNFDAIDMLDCMLREEEKEEE